MGRRRSPYLTKTKVAKNRGIKNTPLRPLTDNTSQDIFYTTESNNTQTSYPYTNKYNNYKDYFTSDIYDSRLFDTYSAKRKGSGESYTFDDYSTSGKSLKKLQKQPRSEIYSMSTSDHIYEPPEKYNNISSFREYDHSYPKGSRGREKKRLRLMKDSDISDYNDVLDESKQYADRDIKYRSPRSRYYQDLIHEEPEKEFDYETYFEKAIPKGGGSPKQRRQDKYGVERYEKQNKLQSRTPNKNQGYQVYAYQDPKHHEDVFKSKNHPGDLSLSSEVEIKTHEYPVLAFRDAKSGNKESDMVYLPIVVLDKKTGKSRPEKSFEEPMYQAKKDNFQIYAANLQEQQNIFKQFGDLHNTTTSKEVANREQTPRQDFSTSGTRYGDSLLGTIIEEAVDSAIRNETLMSETKEGQRIPFTTGKIPFTYQVNVDILPNKPTSDLNGKDERTSQVKNSAINDPLHDGYPVTKDYIKVSVSEQKRASQLAHLKSKEEKQPISAMVHSVLGEEMSKTIKEEPQSTMSIKLIDDQTISKSIAQSKASSTKKSIIRNPPQVLLEEQPLQKDFGSIRQSVATRTKHNSKVSHTEPAMNVTTATKGLATSTKHSVLQEETSKDFRQNKQQSLPPVADHRNTVLHSQPSLGKKSFVGYMASTHSPSSQNMRASHAQSRKSEDGHKSMKASAPERSPEAVSESQGKKSLVKSSAHHTTPIEAGNTGKFPHKIDKKGDSGEALRQFTKDVFDLDLEPQGKTPSHKAEQIKHPSSVVRQNHRAESKHNLRKSAVGQQPSNAARQSQNGLGNVEPLHEHIGDNSSQVGKAPTDEESHKKSGSLFRTTSKVFKALSKVGKHKQAEQQITTDDPASSKRSEGKVKPATTTHDKDDKQFVSSTEPTETQDKNDQNKTQTLTKSNSKAEDNEPKEKKSLTRMFSRSKSKLGNEPGNEKKKMKKSKSKSMLGILKRSKSSDRLHPEEVDEQEGGDKQAMAECKCFAHYMQNSRACAYFFLGTTLHEQIMNIMKVLLPRN